MANKYNSMIAKIQQSGREVVENDLIKDNDWIESAKKIYKMDNGKDFKGSPQEAVQYGLDRMASFNYNISGSHIPGQGKHGGTMPDAVNIHKQDDDTKIAFAYLMDTYDDKDVSWEGVKRFATETATDLTNYIGFGAGLGAKFAVRNTAKTALRKQLIDGISKKLSTQAGVMTSAATLGAGYAGGFNVAEQEVKTQAGLQKKIEPKEAMVHTAIGAVAGPTIVKGVQVAGKGIGKGIDYVRKQGEEAMAQVAGGGTPDMIKLYHGTDAEFDKFDRVGNRITSIGYGHYFSPDKGVAMQYGKNIKEIGIPKSMVLDLDNPTSEQKKLITEQLEKVVPDEIKAGFGGVKRIDITDMNDKDSLALYKQKKADTAHLYHDRAKASVVEEGDKTYIQWMESGLESATNANIKNLIQEYGQNIPKDIGYKAAKSGNEVAVYDTDLVNSSIVKGKK